MLHHQVERRHTNPGPLWRTEGEAANSSYYRARYYDPGTGRFVSQDPLSIRDNVDMYLYVRNNSANFEDPFGLYTLKGFPPDKEAELRKAIDDVIDKLRRTCPSCAGPEGPKVANALDRATFVYHPKSKYCGDVGPFSVLRLHHVVAIGPAAFTPACGSLTCTVAHEGVHLRTGAEKHAGNLEKNCFGCTD